MTSLIQEVKSTLIGLVGQFVGILPGLLMAILIITATSFLAGIVQRLMRRVASKTLNSLSLRSLLVQTSRVGTWAVGILLACVLAFPDLRLGDLVALLGLSSVAIGFAFQDIFKNFLAGILLLLQEPFSIGDQIIVSDYEGTVEDVALRATRIRTYQGEQVVIPNSVVFTSPVQVLTACPQRRTDLGVGVDYNTPLPKATSVLMKALKSVDEVKSNPSPEVDIVEFGDSSINLVARYWTHPEQKCVRRIQTQVMMAIKQAFDQADIGIPYPIRTLYFYNQDQYSDFQPKNSEVHANGTHTNSDHVAAKS
ncbi:mechanosensitive ion channel family protein [Leptolyngbya cf. ectocarpi LEGE 11479]|uniref:Mechanosensitive ion channel family protein n=1 Tax=Leptolyngbya cf. ectocarpi LEGE 11479 TaxID=1828722 RepID=A0A929FAU2_LEPEC|nr:mechanosensitive ion channel family protein [Leptolyngbya ectocarpi]MBE9070221.1 mechanosensitive ion channel family protein [Leptolyngbya cf. ectocarpi LEGE 11479]